MVLLKIKLSSERRNDTELKSWLRKYSCVSVTDNYAKNIYLKRFF